MGPSDNENCRILLSCSQNFTYSVSMLLTKREHAHLILEKNGRKLIIDPGVLTRNLGSVENVDVLVVTHEHDDHWTPDHVQTIREKNPNLRVFSTESAARLLLESVASLSDEQVQAVSDGDVAEVGPFSLTFHGQNHAVIHSTIPPMSNIGVCVNSQLFYGGDSLELPETATLSVLAVPIGSPWSNSSEVVDFTVAIPAKQVFTTHDRMLSAEGKNFFQSLVQRAAEQNGASFLSLEEGKSVEI